VKSRLGFVLVALVMAAAVAHAEDDARSGGAARDEGRGRREEAFRIVDAYVISHLQESLGLSDEQYVKVLPLVTKLQGDRREYFLSRGRVIREMRRLLHAGGGSEAQLVEKLGELKRLESEGPAGTRSDTDALDAALTPLQQAKFRLLELEVEQRMRELMGRARPGSGRRPRD
jgi:hypothetical protein